MGRGAGGIHFRSRRDGDRRNAQTRCAGEAGTSNHHVCVPGRVLIAGYVITSMADPTRASSPPAPLLCLRFKKCFSYARRQGIGGEAHLARGGHA